MILKDDIIFLDSDGIQYNLIEELGEGAFGYVFKISKLGTDEIYAVKTIDTYLKDNRKFEAFQNEVKNALKVKHDNIIEYYFVHDGTLFEKLPPYIIMEFANNGTLKNFIDKLTVKNEFLSDNDLRKIYLQLISGMEVLNSTLIHRDIKPDNILIKDDKLKISDFGLSKVVSDVTRTSTFKGIGHLRYMAPEGWNFEKNTIGMDIYSMGFVFYELATLLHPFSSIKGFDYDEWKDAHLYKGIELPNNINQNLHLSLSQLIMKMIKKDSSERFQDWEEIRFNINKTELETSNAKLISKALKLRMTKDNELERSRLEAIEKEKIGKEFEEHISYQINDKIYLPIKSFIKEFNEAYSGDNIEITELNVSSDVTECNINVYGKSIEFRFRLIKNLTYFQTGYIKAALNTIIEDPELKHFRLNGKIVIGFGSIGFNGIGYNLILVERENDLYGDWFIMENYNNPLFSGLKRDEPICFNLNELGEQIRSINITSVFQTEIKEFKIEIILDFITNSI